jgi:hypothetical protein
LAVFSPVKVTVSSNSIDPSHPWKVAHHMH